MCLTDAYKIVISIFRVFQISGHTGFLCLVLFLPFPPIGISFPPKYPWILASSLLPTLFPHQGTGWKCSAICLCHLSLNILPLRVPLCSCYPSYVWLLSFSFFFQSPGTPSLPHPHYLVEATAGGTTPGVVHLLC